MNWDEYARNWNQRWNNLGGAELGEGTRETQDEFAALVR